MLRMFAGTVEVGKLMEMIRDASLNDGSIEDSRSFLLRNSMYAIFPANRTCSPVLWCAHLVDAWSPTVQPLQFCASLAPG